MALVAASVARRTTGWVAARHETTRAVLVGEEEEQLQTQSQSPIQTPHTHSCVLGRRRSSGRGLTSVCRETVH